MANSMQNKRPSNAANTGFLHRLGRVLRHWAYSTASARRAFPQATLDAITQAIQVGESSHRGQLRLIVEHALPSDDLWAGRDHRQRALALFAEYAIWDTEDNCGVLIYVN